MIVTKYTDGFVLKVNASELEDIEIALVTSVDLHYHYTAMVDAIHVAPTGEHLSARDYLNLMEE